MKRRQFVQSISTTAVGLGITSLSMATTPILNEETAATRKLLIYGAGVKKDWLKYLIKLTGKPDPKICYVPTATGDSVNSITTWYAMCEDLPLQPYVLKMFISSYNTQKSFEETVMSMDVIVISGGNTLNMLAVWKAQGLDAILRKAYDSGIIMSGGSAGSLCWFENGTTDSRPIKVSKIDCLGWVKGSHCPHYNSEATRRPLYHDLILKGDLYPGYACDDQSGIYFENEKFVKAYALDDKSKSFYVGLKDGKIDEKELAVEVLKF